MLVLNGSAEMEMAGDDLNKQLLGASKVTRAGQKLIDEGGLPLVREVYAMLGEYQRTVDLQWFGLSDGCNTWLP